MKSFLLKTNDKFWNGLVLPIFVFLCLLLFLYFGIGNVTASSDEESRIILEKAAHRAVVQCYAIEGMYPPNVKYLENHYGIVFDHEQYIIHYEVFASNILPDITVIDLNIRKE